MSSDSVSAPTPAARMPAAERRAAILDAARTLFGRTGYAGTTTDQIAQAAGISQPYVVRMFGSKERLFLEVLDRSLTTLLDAFRTALADTRAEGASTHDTQHRIGRAFLDLAGSQGLHTLLLQAFVSGAEPAIGAAARAGFLEIDKFLRDEAGFPPDEIQSFLASGMLFSVLLGVEMPSLYGTDDAATALMDASFGEKCQDIVASFRARVAH